ncbi:type I restriction endonuclease [Iningainema tapete]|uniref:type I site-specific deoxyribonuclease n=1 Tax=Iningainema tapete BLCC-T55 TaxID=2748662 RepID=A0A8J6XPZ0_9CYAN|nr:type I restriction endonuclease [Iningainema tapete]MBD2775206.1 type I restriction endonuclease subunit R [Iningainema tapete BLCC-T55]
MNRALLRIATVNATSFPTKLRRRFNSSPSIAVPDFLTWFEVIGYTVLLESDIASRHKIECSYDDVVLRKEDEWSLFVRHRLRSALQRINPQIPHQVIDTVICTCCTSHPDLPKSNYHFHQLLTEGVDVTYYDGEQTVHDKVWLIDSSNLLNNDWLVIHPFSVTSPSHAHPITTVVLINGLPLAVIVQTHPRHVQALRNEAYQSLQKYIQQQQALFSYNALAIACCGNRAKVGTLTSNWQEFLPWRSIDGEDFSISGTTELEVLIQGIFDKRRFLELIKDFIKFEDTGTSISKKLLRHPFCTIKNPKNSLHNRQ